jgi:hypothetical protein
MKILKKIVKLEGSSYFTKHLEIINPMLPIQMTPKEMEVLGNFMSLEGETAEVDRFGTTCRKIIKKRLNLSDGGLGNYIKTLKEKGLIINYESTLFIPKFLWCGATAQGYMFQLEKVGSTVPKQEETHSLEPLPVKEVSTQPEEEVEIPYRMQ